MRKLRILFTGATSFTGMWFVRKLADNGHDVVSAIRSPRKSYSGLRAERLGQLAGCCSFAWNLPFGAPEFIDLIRSEKPFDLLCHHAAEVKDYKSPDFDVAAATASNGRALPAVLDALHDTGCHRLILTGSVFEANEGMGTPPLRAFSPYGLSKTLTFEKFRHETVRSGIALGKFVIPNPFGPYEEPRFTHYLMNCWKNGKVAQVNTPAYVRDNVPVSLLAASYASFAAGLPTAGLSRLNPSFYAETQAEFARRFAREMGLRLDLPTPLELADQTDFPEPAVRINTDTLRGVDFDWSEKGFWDETAKYYAGLLDIPVI